MKTKSLAGAKTVVFDTDPGMGFPWADVDDNLAVLFALAQESLSIDLICTVCGNVTAEDGVRSISRTLSLARRMVPVAIGARSPLVRPYRSGREILADIGNRRGARLSYQGEFKEGVERVDAPSAFPVQVQLLENAKDRVTFVCVGPLTNMASLLQQRPDLCSRIEAIVIMGGALNVKGNISPLAEFNTWVDPEAARIVFDADIEKVLAPLDLTTTVALTMEEMRSALDSKNSLGSSILRATEGWVEAMKVLGGRSIFNPHDPIALAGLVAPELFETKRMQILVEESTGKMTGREGSSGNTRVCVRVDEPGFKKLLLGSLRSVSQRVSG
jgi:pyrimidine-specific ribonucleoside hydrolase